MKVFLDTNVLASAVATHGICADLMRDVLSQHELYISAHVLGELTRVLQQKFQVPEAVVSEFTAFLSLECILVQPVELPTVRIKDQDDLPVLGAAVECNAEILVTGDKELLRLGSIHGTRIISPRAYWEESQGRNVTR